MAGSGGGCVFNILKNHPAVVHNGCIALHPTTEHSVQVLLANACFPIL